MKSYIKEEIKRLEKSSPLSAMNLIFCYEEQYGACDENSLIKIRILIDNNKIDKARECIDTLIDREEYEGELSAILGDLALMEDDYDTALDCYKKACEYGYCDMELLNKIKSLELRNQNYKISLFEILHNYVEKLDRDEFMVLEGLVAEANYEFEVALKIFFSLGDKALWQIYDLAIFYMMQNKLHVALDLFNYILFFDKKDELFYFSKYMFSMLVDKANENFDELEKYQIELMDTIEMSENPFLNIKLLKIYIMTLKDMNMDEELNEIIELLKEEEKKIIQMM